MTLTYIKRIMVFTSVFITIAFQLRQLAMLLGGSILSLSFVRGQLIYVCLTFRNA